LDTRGNFVATTEKGKLVFVDKKVRRSKKEPGKETCCSKTTSSRTRKTKSSTRRKTKSKSST
jgi:hypothetical protein